MAPSDSGTELFDQAQVARILQRMAELQARTRGRPTTGLTLEELHELAAESGFDPLLVSAALSELRTESAMPDATWWGGPVEFNLEHTFRGTVGTQAWERMIELIRRALGQEGDIEKRGDTREWIRTVRDGNGGRVSIREDGGETTIHIFWRVAMPTILLYMANAVMALLSVPILIIGLGLLPGLPVWIAFVASVFFLMRWLVSRNTSSERHRATALMGELARVAAEEVPDSGREHEPLALEEPSTGLGTMTRDLGSERDALTDEPASPRGRVELDEATEPQPGPDESSSGRVRDRGH